MAELLRQIKLLCDAAQARGWFETNFPFVKLKPSFFFPA